MARWETSPIARWEAELRAERGWRSSPRARCYDRGFQTSVDSHLDSAPAFAPVCRERLRIPAEAFFDAIRENCEPEVTVQDGARATIGCLQMLESARTLAPSNIDLEEVMG